MEEYKHILYNGNVDPHTIELRSLRLSRESKMARYTILRKGLSDLFYKMRVADDKITCTPLTFRNEYL